MALIDFNGGGSLADLCNARSRQVEEVARSAASKQAESRETEGSPTSSIFADMTWEDSTAGKLRSGSLPPLEWTFPGLLLTHNVALLIGLPGTGKSYFGNQLGAYVASGRGCEGIFEPGGVRGKVLVLAGEEDERIVPRRVRSLGSALFQEKSGLSDFNRDAEEVDFNRNLIVKSLAGASLQLLDREGPGTPYRTNVFDDLLQFCRKIPDLQLIIVDPLSRFMGLSENDNGDGTAFITALEYLGIKTGASIVCVHHVGKGGKTWLDSLTAYAARGASGLVGAVRAQMNIVALTKKEAKSAIDPPEEPRDGEYLALAFPKISYGPSRPYVFLRRGRGGILYAVDPAQKSNDELQLEDTILRWIRAKIAEQAAKGLPSLTLRGLGELTKEWGCIIGASKTKVRDVASAAVLNGELFLEATKNSKGKSVEYLRLDDPDMENKPMQATPASTPASETPATPAETGQGVLACV